MKSLTMFLCSCIIAAALQGQVIYVHPDSLHNTIQSGINAAETGDTVLVLQGTYYEQINFQGKAITVASEFLTTGDPFKIMNTIIDGTQIDDPEIGSIVNFTSGTDTNSVLCGFTIQNGNTGTLFAGLVGETIRAGGAICIDGSGARIIHNRIINNHLVNSNIPGNPMIVRGAGVYTSLVQEEHWIILDHNTFDNNTVESDLIQAGAAAAFISYNAIITNNSFTNNRATATEMANSFAGGLACAIYTSWNLQVYAFIDGNTFSNNQSSSESATSHGGAILTDCYKAVFSNNILNNNAAQSTGNNGNGGGLFFSNPRGNSKISKNTFENNFSQGSGGALRITYDVGSIPNMSLLPVEKNFFTNNEANSGGAIAVYDKPVSIQNNVFSGNLATIGGAVTLEKVLMTLTHLGVFINSSFSQNSASSAGGAIYSIHSMPLIMNSVFWNDSADLAASSEIYISSLQDSVEIASSNIDFSLINQNKIDGGGNINTDPLFDDPELLSLTSSSPCISVASENFTCKCGHTYYCPDTDINDTIRPREGGYDMGAYEYVTPVSVPEPVKSQYSGIICYPNPCSNILNFNFKLAGEEHVLLQLFDNSGKIVAVIVNRNFAKGTHDIAFDVSGLPSGLYHYRIITDDYLDTGVISVVRR